MRRGKYNVAAKEDRTMDNIVFDSKREMERYAELKMLFRSGIIRNLELQPILGVTINGMKVCDVIPDFGYVDEMGRQVYEDSKGMRSGAAYQMFKLKAKLVFAVTGLRILET